LDERTQACRRGELLGWTLDAFDFFLLVFVVKEIAQEFNARRLDLRSAIAYML
jgi:SHS family lactate transporter-like MFS transporter